MKPSQAELILRIAENTYSDGDGVIAEMRQLGGSHWRRVMEDAELIAKAKEVNEADQKRFAQYAPQQQRPRPELQQSPTTALPMRELLKKADREAI